MVTPYFTQHSPPALVAALPPIEHISNDDGSGGYHSPCSAAAFFTSTLSSPGWVIATREMGSMRMSRIFSSESTTPPSTAVEPPDSPEPAPRGYHRDVVRRGPAQHRLHVLGAGRPHDGDRPPGIRISRPVLPVPLDHIAIGEHRALGQRRHQFVAQPIVHSPW